MGILEEINEKLGLILAKLDCKPIDTEKPTEPEKPEPPKPIDEIDITDLWYDTFKKGHGELILESGKTYSISTVQRIKINGKVRIKTDGYLPAYLWVGKAFYTLYVDSGQDSILFELDNGADILIDNIWPSMREQNRNVQQIYSINWFTSVQNPNAKWTAIVKNCDTTYLAKNGGFGTGTLYGGVDGNYIAFINYKHAGPMLSDLKNPYKDCVLYWVMENVKTDYSNPKEWSKREHLTIGKIAKSNNVLSLTGSVQASCLFNHFFNTDTGSNRASIAHIGRFTFMIDSINAVIDLKNIQLRPSPKQGEQVFVKKGRFFFKDREPHALDSFTIANQSYTITQKLRTENDEWTNNWGNGDSPETVRSPQCFVDKEVNLKDGFYNLESYTGSFDLYDSDHPIYLIYKDDVNFRTTPDTLFGDYQVLLARDGGHICYNHRSISIWAKNVILEGYYRESTLSEGKSLGYNLVDCKGFDDEFSEKQITTDKPMPEVITKLIEKL